MSTTMAQREEYVKQANANAAQEGLEPTEVDRMQQRRYINGEITIEDLIAQAGKLASLDGEPEA
jgi:hypothetical protein